MIENGELRIKTPRAFAPLLKPSRYKAAYGGRGSGKSHFFAESLLELAIIKPRLRWLCTREVQRSLKQSVKLLLEDKIKALGVEPLFRIMHDQVLTPGGGAIVFLGMGDQTADSIKSLEAFDGAWFEEAQTCSQRSLDLLRPTIRKEESELWFSWNPGQAGDPVDSLFRGPEPPPDAVVVCVTWRDNPWFPSVLQREVDYDYRTDPDAAGHVWGGDYWRRSDSQVLAGKWRVEDFEPREDWAGPYHGADWGFARDPTVLVRFWLRPDGGLMIEAEAYRVGVDLLDTPDLFVAAAPDVRKHVIRADSARPETIHHMQRVGFRCEGAPKWAGSVEDGIAWLRGRPEIVIHSRCVHMADEARHWRYKTDKLTGDVLPALVPGHDHGWDAVRYGAAPVIRNRTWRPL